MALVFISHAHSDESLARGITSLLGDALALTPADFFISSQEGRGVAPAANIRQEIFVELSAARALIVLLTPKSACSPWVWLEAGNRLGRADKVNPLFVYPSERFVSLMQPVADLRGLRLDDEDELVGLVQAVAKCLERPPLDFLTYKPALTDLARSARLEYSPARETRAKVVSWVVRHSAALVLASLTALGFWYGRLSFGRAQEEIQSSEIQRNQDAAAIAARYLILTGTVISEQGNVPIPDALVTASWDQAVKEQVSCQEPRCTFQKTTTDGEFRIDLTKIQAKKDDSIVLSVVKPDFGFFTQNVSVDVRAMDVRVAPHKVTLQSPPGQMHGTTGSQP